MQKNINIANKSRNGTCWNFLWILFMSVPGKVNTQHINSRDENYCISLSKLLDFITRLAKRGENHVQVSHTHN